MGKKMEVYDVDELEIGFTRTRKWWFMVRQKWRS